MKKIIAIVLALAAILSLAACNGSSDKETKTLTPETTEAPAAQLEGTLEEISAKILEKATTVEFMMGPATEIDLSDIDAAKYYIGIDPTDKVERATFTEPMIGAQPFSLCLIEAKDGADLEALKNEILETVNMRKWMCVGAEKLIVSNCGNTILMVMGSEVMADDVYNAFTAISNNTASPALTKAGEANEEPPVDGEADMDAPAAMPGEDEGIMLG